MKTIWRVFAYLKRYPLLASAMLACAVIGTLMLIVFPLVTKQVLDVVIHQHHPEKLMPLVWLASYPRSGNTLLRQVLKASFDLASCEGLEPVPASSNTVLDPVEFS